MPDEVDATPAGTAPAGTAPGAGGPVAVATRALRLNLVACVALVCQFALGMVANLFVTVPHDHPGARAHDFFAGVGSAIAWLVPDGPAWLAAHVALGLALVAAALANLAVAPRFGSRRYTTASVVGALTILGAAFNGASFVDYGHDFSSMIMAGLWALALLSYLACLYLAGRGALGLDRGAPPAR